MGLINIKRIFSIGKKLIPTDVKSTTTKLAGAVTKGYSTGKRCNSIYDKKLLPRAKVSTASITRELGKLEFTKDEIPALAASIVYLIPIPSPIPLTPIVYGVGYSINKGLKLANKLINRIT